MHEGRYPDLQVQNEGSLILLHAFTDQGARFIGEHAPEDAQFFGQALVIEPRYAETWITNAISQGLRCIS